MLYLLQKLWNKIRILNLDRKIKYKGINVIISPGFTFGEPHKLELEDHIYIGPYSNIWATGGVKIGSGTIISSRVTIHSSNHNYQSPVMIPYDKKTILEPVIIGRGCWIGDSVMICPGVNIGECSVIAMGSVVTKDIESYSVVGGNPARLIKQRNKDICQPLLENDNFYIKNKMSNR